MNRKYDLIRLFYTGLLLVGAACLSPLLAPWVLLREKRRKTIGGRLWLRRRPAASETTGRSLWLHALSVGEVLSAAPLIDELARVFPDRAIVMTTSTKTGRDIAAARFREKVAALHYFPMDIPFAINRALKTIRPELLVLVETDLWPNVLATLHRRGVPAVLVNSRLSRRSLAGYRRFSFFFLPMFSSLSAIGAQSDTDARRLLSLGIGSARIQVTGNLKFDQLLPASADPAPALRCQLTRGTQVLLAGSTHPGEEDLLLKAFGAVKARFPLLRLILAPRDPKRAPGILRHAKTAGHSAAPLTDCDGQTPLPSARVLVVARMGILSSLYSLCDIAFIGGSLVPRGGHNPLEAALWEKPILTGPDMSDFADISRMLVKGGGAVTVKSAEELAAAVSGLLADTEKARAMGAKARQVLMQNRGATTRCVRLIQAILSSRTSGEAP